MTAAASSKPSGMPTSLAKWLSVPSGSTPSGTPVPASRPAAQLTLPSPPPTTTPSSSPAWARSRIRVSSAGSSAPGTRAISACAPAAPKAVARRRRSSSAPRRRAVPPPLLTTTPSRRAVAGAPAVLWSCSATIVTAPPAAARSHRGVPSPRNLPGSSPPSPKPAYPLPFQPPTIGEPDWEHVGRALATHASAGAAAGGPAGVARRSHRRGAVGHGRDGLRMRCSRRAQVARPAPEVEPAGFVRRRGVAPRRRGPAAGHRRWPAAARVHSAAWARVRPCMPRAARGADERSSFRHLDSSRPCWAW